MTAGSFSGGLAFAPGFLSASSFVENLVPDRLPCLHVHDFDVAAKRFITVDGKNLVVHRFKPDIIRILAVTDPAKALQFESATGSFRL